MWLFFGLFWVEFLFRPYPEIDTSIHIDLHISTKAKFTVHFIFIRPLPEQPLQNVRNLQQQTALATASKLYCHELRTSAQLTIDNQRQAEAGPLDTHPLSQHTFWHSDMFYGYRAMYISSQAFFQTFSSPFTQVLTVSAVLLLPAALSPAANCSPRRVLLVSTYLHIYVSTDETAAFYNRGCRVEKPVTCSRLLSSHSRWSLIAAWLNWIIGPGKKCHNSEDVMLSCCHESSKTSLSLHHHFTRLGLAYIQTSQASNAIKRFLFWPILTHCRDQ